MKNTGMLIVCFVTCLMVLCNCSSSEQELKAVYNYNLVEYEDLLKFIKKYPKEWIAFLTRIIYISNKRILESNYLLTSNYEISKTISEIDLYNNKNLFKLIDKFQKVLGVNYIIFLERNPVVYDYFVLRYDTRDKWKMINMPIDLWENWCFDEEDLLNLWVILSSSNHIQELRNNNEIIWYIVIDKNSESFTDSKKKAISSISTLLAWVVKQKQNYEEERDKEYIDEE